MAHSLVSLGQIAKFIRGVTYKPDELMENFSDGSVVCMRTANIQAQLDESDLRSIPAGLVKSTDKLLKEGDILVSTANSWNLVGKCCWVPKLSYAAAPGGFIAALRADPARIDPRYLYHWFNSPETQADARNCGRQTTNISNMDLGRCLALQTPLPQLAEQRRIAAILDKADALRAKRREAIAKLEKLLQSVFLDMFGDPIANSRAWRLKKLGDVLVKLTDGTHHSPPPAASGIPYVTAKHIKVGRVEFEANPTFVSAEDHRAIYARCDPKTGDVLYIKDGATTGVAAINRFEHEFSMLSSVALLRPKTTEVNAEYLESWLNSPLVKESIIVNMGGAAIKRLTLTKIGSLSVSIPPLEVQEAFATAKRRILRMRETHARSHLSVERLFVSLQQRAFSGASGS